LKQCSDKVLKDRLWGELCGAGAWAFGVSLFDEKMWRVCVWRGVCIASCWGNRREGAHWGDLGVDVWIILRWISRRWAVGIWTGLGWPRTGGGYL